MSQRRELEREWLGICEHCGAHYWRTRVMKVADGQIVLRWVIEYECEHEWGVRG